MSDLWSPKGPDDFMVGVPTSAQWEAEIRSGWPGPDGSSASFDDVEGVRIGVTSPSYDYAHLPANLHDYHYRVLRRLIRVYERQVVAAEIRRNAGYTYAFAPWAINEAQWRHWRRSADLRHYSGLLVAVRELIGWSGRKANVRAWGRYTGLRLFGASSARPDDRREKYL